MKMLNIGCGNITHPQWINIDFVSNRKEIVKQNILKGLQFDNLSVDIIYHSHLLEHLTKKESAFFLNECYRVLRMGGIMRVVVPDLMSVIKEYQKLYTEVESDKLLGHSKLDWIKIELFDQVARNNYGGEMIDFVKTVDDKLKDFIIKRTGEELFETDANQVNRKYSALEFFNKIKEKAGELILWIIGGEKFKKAFKTGLFRYSGEVHYQMFDALSLIKILEKAGFKLIKNCNGFESQITDFIKFGFDIQNGKLRKPNSLFMEVTKL
jgi:predicted SAM-dependent methyltransferase